jgi:hypothetical protein
LVTEVKHADYSQMHGRRELFEQRRDRSTPDRRRRWAAPVFAVG